MTDSKAEIIEARRKAAIESRRIAQERARRQAMKEAMEAQPVLAGGGVPARLRMRHLLVALSFVFLFVLPSALVVGYLYTRAADQYVSRAQFSVSDDGFILPSGFIDQILEPQSLQATDTDILFAYINSQAMVERVDARLDLRRIYRKQSERDPVLGFGDSDAIEDLLSYWRRMIDVTYEPRQGIIGVRARAFTPEDALRISRAIVDESHRLINALTRTAREDAVRYAKVDLEEARRRLEADWARLRRFRDENRVVLPTADAQLQLNVIGALRGQLNQALVERAQLTATTVAQDPRLVRIDRHIAAIGNEIARLRAELAAETDSRTGKSVIGILSAYEALLVDVEFSRKAYLSALAGLDVARIQARRISRYLKVHVQPTLPQSPEYPDRLVLSLLIPFLLLVSWVIMVLMAYNVRDRK
ncbi:MAG: hypothetical protein D6754_15795 [Alphaproteobacteria bacterium]|nr:MAG: hypothetical protein D6754_15795 [Alphaproteobacteria bacterium]